MQKKRRLFLRGQNGLVKQSGQMSAPFELFVAVIIMGFVVIIGSQMIANANANVCLNSVDKAMATFKTKLEETANQRSSNQFFFSPDRCFDAAKAKIGIEKYNNSKVCSAKCGKPWDSCFTMSFYAEDIPNAYIEKCLNIPQYTTFFSSLDSGMCEGLQDYEAISPGNGGIKLGQYILRNVANIGATYPSVCIYYKAA